MAQLPPITITSTITQRPSTIHSAQSRLPVCLVLSLALWLGAGLQGCNRLPGVAPTTTKSTSPSSARVASASHPGDAALLAESWAYYQERFIQADGRVIDWETDDQRTTSEGQAYAMLRAVLMDDPDTFEQVLQWGENNLLVRSHPVPPHQLWAWKWGPDPDSNWGILDPNFASDADIDVATALILATRRWQRPDYLALAQQKLADLWSVSTIEVVVNGQSQRHLLPGPRAAFQPTVTTLYLNPSYLAPYAFRLFAQVDPTRDWLSLVPSSYQTLEASAKLSTLGLPSNWVKLDLTSGQYSAIPTSNALQTLYGFDAYRVWWRITLDAIWFQSPEADQYLRQHLPGLMTFWQQQQRLPAQVSLAGEILANYESTAQYAMVYSALKYLDIETARTLRQQKLDATYRQGFWDSDSAYYTQNLAWLGLFPPAWVPDDWLQAKS
jgi:endo-1,4-beta-D-glucanase Y